MNYKLINNLSDKNDHSTRMKELFNESDSIILTSPFLMTDFADFFGEVDFSQLKKFHLITTLLPKSFDQIRKVNSLVSLIEFPEIKNRKVNCQISLNNKLHGKIYIFKKNENYISAIISSANFTENGLSRNHEWGVEISDTEEIMILEKSIIDSIDFPNLSFDEIYKMDQATTVFLSEQPQTEKREIDLNLTDLISFAKLKSQLDGTMNFWLKPIGVTDHPVKEDELFNVIDDRLNFSKQRPNGVKPDDILIAYGVGTTKILTIYRATSYPLLVTELEKEKEEWLNRWPWYVTAHNLTPIYGENWAHHNLYINFLKDEYLRANPTKPITAVGGQTLGALMYGKDKLKLSSDFAKFIIDKVVEATSSK